VEMFVERDGGRVKMAKPSITLGVISLSVGDT